MTRAQLLEELAVERFGPIPRHGADTPAHVTEFELLHERAQQRMNRDLLEEGVRRGQTETAA